jgi:hypothetical protein
MKRGPEPAKGFDAALPVAHRRGQVMLFRSAPWYTSNFMIRGNGMIALVSLRFARRIRATIAEITKEYCDAVTTLSSVPRGGPVSIELWLYSRRGTLRCFRIGIDGLEEIDFLGALFVNGSPVVDVPQVPGARIPVPPGQVGTGSAGSVPVDKRGPILRWLAKKNAGKKLAAVTTGATSPAGPVKSTGAGNREPAGSVRDPEGGSASLPGTPVTPGHPGSATAVAGPGEQAPVPPIDGAGGGG